MKRLRILFCLAFYAIGFSGTPAIADGAYLNIPNAHQLLEHLVRHSDELVTEVNLTRANQFWIVQPVLQGIQTQGGWGGAMYGRLLSDPRNAVRTPEYFIGQIVNDFRMETILLYDFWWEIQRPPPRIMIQFPDPQQRAQVLQSQFNAQFIKTDYTYANAMAATYWYIEALRRSYGVQGWATQPILLRRLQKLDRLAWEIRELMMSVRYAASFRFPMRPVCLESTYRPYRVNVGAVGPQNFVPFPFTQGNQTFAPQNIRPVAPGANGNGAPAYDAQYWNGRFNTIDNNYINGYQPNLPANYDERPFTPANPGQNPRVNPGQNPGVNPGQNPGVNPGQNPGVNPGQNPGVNPGQNPGQNPQVRDPLANPVNPGVQPGGTNPGTQPGYPVPASGDVAPSNDYRYPGN